MRISGRYCSLCYIWSCSYPRLVKDIENGKYNVILTSPEQCFSVDGHRTRFNIILHDKPKFVRKIKCLIVDEAHLIHRWGSSLLGEAAFRPA